MKTMLRKRVPFAVVAAGLVLVAAPLHAGFGGNDLYLPSVGAQAGVPPAVWYTTVWVHNPNPTPANVTFYLLERQANPQPLTYTEIVEPGGTARYENAVELLFGRQTFGALRLTADVDVVAGSRIYAQSGELEEDSVGQYFAAIPASFAIGSGQSTELLGVYSTLPAADSTFRYNFGFVETTGTGTCEVRVTVKDPAGSPLAEKTYTVREWEQVQKAFTSEFPTLSTENARLTVEVTSGSGRVIPFGSGVANGSQDATTFEMSFREELLGGGLMTVAHDATLTGDGTTLSLLGIAAGQTVRSLNGLRDAVSLVAGANVTITPAGSSLTIAATGGGGGLPAGTAGQTLRSNGSTWVASSGLTNDDTNVRLSGKLWLPATASGGTAGVLNLGTERFLHGYGPAADAGNTFLGQGAGNFTMGGTEQGDGKHNTAVGANALTANTTGSSNTAVGWNSLTGTTYGEGNTATGVASLHDNSTGSDNTATGVSSLYDNTSGRQNTATGRLSLGSNTSGTYNTAVGYHAGNGNTTGRWNTYVGAQSTPGSHGDLQNATAIGYGAVVSASNHVRIGNGEVTQIGGYVGWTNVSDARHKTDIRDLDVGLEFVLALRPVAFTLNQGDGRTDMGFLAQDVEALLGDGYGVLGIGGDEERTLSLRYTDLIAPLVKAVQEQQAEIDALREQLAEQDALGARLAELERQVESLRAAQGPQLSAPLPVVGAGSGS